MRKLLVAAVVLTVFSVTNQAKAEDEAVLSLARKAGVQKCLPKLKEVADYLELPNTDYQAYDSYYTKATNDRNYSSIVIRKYSDDATSLAVSNLSPYGDGCDTTLLQVFTSNTSCTETRETVLKSWKFVATVKDVIKLQNEKGDISFYLKPVGSGCVAVKIE